MIQIKQGTVFQRLRPEIYNIFGLIDRLFQNMAGVDCVITSANDGKHMAGSKHYQDLAIDLRSHHIQSEIIKQSIVQTIAHELGDKYQVLHEYQGTPDEHIHVEYDPIRQ